MHNTLNIWHIVNQYSRKPYEISISRINNRIDIKIYKSLSFFIFSIRYKIKDLSYWLKTPYDQTFLSDAVDKSILTDANIDFTNYMGWVYSVFNRTTPEKDLTQAAMGLTGEASEIQENVKRYLFHGGKLDRVDMAMEMGDVLFYFTLFLINNKLKLHDIINTSMTKLNVRYPNGREGNNYVVNKNHAKEREAVENILNAN